MALAENVARIALKSNGRAVVMLMVEPMPPLAMSARPVLYTLIPAMPSAERFSKSNERVAFAAWRDDVARHGAAVQGHQVEFRTEAAHRHARTFVVHTVDGHAGNALDGFGEVGVGELADVLGGNGIDDARSNRA